MFHSMRFPISSTHRRDRQSKEKKAVELKKKRKAATLSFSVEELEGDAEDVVSPKKVPAPSAAASSAAAGGAGAPVDNVKKSKFGKDPTVETSFLPDKDREREEAAMVEKLKQEWAAEQERIKKEQLTITYSYWDGSGHRRDINVLKGVTIGKFLEAVRQVRVVPSSTPRTGSCTRSPPPRLTGYR